MKLTQYQIIIQFEKIHHKKYGYNEVKYINNNTKVKIYCFDHEKYFYQTPHSHKIGQGCSECGAKKQIINRKSNLLSQENIINSFKKMHGNKYHYPEPYIKDNVKMKIICLTHGDFFQTPNTHKRGSGCKKCYLESKFLSCEIIIKQFKEIHGNKYIYPEKFLNNEKIKIICIKHGEFLQTPERHKKGQGCKKCFLDRNKLTYEKTINQFKKIHGDNYIYPEFQNYKTVNDIIIIICKIHGEFLQTPFVHKKGSGCSLCKNPSLTHDEVMEQFKVVHGNKYKYPDIYIKSSEKIRIICDKHGYFYQNSSDHKNGSGCPVCVKHISKLELCWLESYNLPNDKNYRQVCKLIPGRKFIVDGFNPLTNTIYEFYGDYWHGNPKIYNSKDINPGNNKTYGDLYQKTLEKEKLIKKYGFNLITIWESDWIKLNNNCVSVT